MSRLPESLPASCRAFLHGARPRSPSSASPAWREEDHPPARVTPFDRRQRRVGQCRAHPPAYRRQPIPRRTSGYHVSRPVAVGPPDDPGPPGPRPSAPRPTTPRATAASRLRCARAQGLSGARPGSRPGPDNIAPDATPAFLARSRSVRRRPGPGQDRHPADRRVEPGRPRRTQRRRHTAGPRGLRPHQLVHRPARSRRRRTGDHCRPRRQPAGPGGLPPPQELKPATR